MPGFFRQSYGVSLRVAGPGEGVLESDVEPQIVGFSCIVVQCGWVVQCGAHKAGAFPWIARCLVRACHVVQKGDVSSCCCSQC